MTTKQETEKSGNNIRIQDGNFAWDPESTTPTLRNVNLEVKRGQKVTVCGNRTKYIGGKRNSAVVHVFQLSKRLGDGKLMDAIYEVWNRFRYVYGAEAITNGQRYGFVRFKLVEDMGLLIGRLREIKIGELTLKVFLAYDRKNPGDDRKMDIRSEKNKYERGWEEKKEECKNQDDKLNPKKVYEEIRRLEVSDEEVNLELFNRCLIGDITSLRYLTKISDLCHEQGLSKVEVKLLGGLEIMLVFDTPETATNIPSCIDHGLRRWVHKLRRWSKFYIVPGRLTWINILGVPVTCWTEQIHTWNKGLIREKLIVKVLGKELEVNVVEEVGDIMEVEWGEEDDDSNGEEESDGDESQLGLRSGNNGGRNQKEVDEES
ncbi:transposon TX1, partial [Tanacetum coccineum]